MNNKKDECLSILFSDISGLFKDPPPGMFIAPDPDNIMKV
jgi:hypothetical protein